MDAGVLKIIDIIDILESGNVVAFANEFSQTTIHKPAIVMQIIVRDRDKLLAHVLSLEDKSLLNTTTCGGCTRDAISYATKTKAAKCLDVLLKDGSCNVNGTDCAGRKSALYYALDKHRIDLAYKLIDYGATLETIPHYMSIPEAVRVYLRDRTSLKKKCTAVMLLSPRFSGGRGLHKNILRNVAKHLWNTRNELTE